MADPQIENINVDSEHEKIVNRRENMRKCSKKRYTENTEELQKYGRQYYYANREKILERAKERRIEKAGARPPGRPRKYASDANNG